MKKTHNSPLTRFNRRFLSDATGIHACTLGRIIRGEREATKTEKIALESVTGIEIDDLFPTDQDEEQAS